ncbi:hypothetical protein ACN42_g2995 [Penicillium freii]|uniref:Uncharacterized protein n=1 Tax=Penicillium freii TaxID=48697 RepID=A0A124GSE1_PENFR|nr:hypothetical protein ACN42_g2995 [Penicillium freii]
MWGGLFLIGERWKVQVKALRGGKVDLQFCISRELSNYPNVSVENFIEHWNFSRKKLHPNLIGFRRHNA